MPLGIISDEQLDRELNRINPESQAKIVNINRGRIGNETPESLRKIIGEESLVTPSKALQEIFDVSPSSVGAYKNGATSCTTYNEPNESLLNHVNKRREEISSTARIKLISALGHITDDKLKEAKVRDVAGIAKDMSVVIKNLEPEVSTESNSVQFVFFAPNMKTESDYPNVVIDVSNS